MHACVFSMHTCMFPCVAGSNREGYKLTLHCFPTPYAPCTHPVNTCHMHTRHSLMPHAHTPFTHAGSNKEGYTLTLEFVKAMLAEFKEQRKIHA